MFHGNNDDCFKFGISFANTSIKFFSQFYSSDIIIASPLGLKLVTGTEGDRVKDRETDFLSSIEVVVMAHAEVLTMQNLEHLTDVLSVVNTVPYQQREADFARIRTVRS